MSSLSTRRSSLRLFFVGIICLIFHAATLEAAQTARIDIPAVVYLTDDAFHLGDVARIDAPARARDLLASLILSTSGGWIEREDVLRAIEGSGLSDLRVELRMPARVRVETPGFEGNGTDPDELPSSPPPSPPSRPSSRADAPSATLSSMVRSLASWDGGVEVTASGPVPPGRLVEPASIVPGSAAATLRFRDDAGRTRSLSVRMTWTQDVLVAARTIGRGVPLAREDLMVRSMKILRPGVWATSEAQAVGHVSRKPIKQGEPIPLELLSGPMRLKKGRRVTIMARYGGLTATADGVLIEDGEPGDTVRVRRADDKKTVLMASIIDEDTVEVIVR